MKTLICLAVLLVPSSASEFCYLKSDRVDGLNRICTYTCPSGGYAITVKSAQLCPISVKR